MKHSTVPIMCQQVVRTNRLQPAVLRCHCRQNRRNPKSRIVPIRKSKRRHSDHDCQFRDGHRRRRAPPVPRADVGALRTIITAVTVLPSRIMCHRANTRSLPVQSKWKI